jgi:hypothetical protein
MVTQSKLLANEWGGKTETDSKARNFMGITPKPTGVSGPKTTQYDRYVMGRGQSETSGDVLSRATGSNMGVGNTPRYHEQAFQTRETRNAGLDFVQLPQHGQNSLLQKGLSTMWAQKAKEAGPIRRAISRLL